MNKKEYVIAHFADTHIKNLKNHKEYKLLFTQMFEKLKEVQPDFIVHAGDIGHTKTQISPEFVDLTAWFLDSLANIAKTFVILGNHDGNCRNNSRQDAISPIVSALNNPNLHLLKASGEMKIDDQLVFNVMSIFDEENWVKPTDLSKINIALYHGSVKGVKTDTGYILEHGDIDISEFENFDYALLGDIHRTNQKLDDEGRVRYPGSTVQQGYGETDDKGFLVWKIRSKDDFDVDQYIFENPNPYVTVELESDGKIPSNFVAKEGSRIRIVGNNSLTLQQTKRAVDVVKSRFKPDTVTFYNKAVSNNNSSVIIANDTGEMDLRNPKVQDKLIKEFLKDYDVEDSVMEKVLDLNKKYNAMAEETEETLRNIKWSLKSLEWDNLFNYGEKNSIDFENLNGVVGIFGKNFSGKSSIVDSFLWTLQNSTSKNVRKNLNIINQNRNSGAGKCVLTVDNDTYVVERTSEKYLKKLRGDETQEAKTDLNFSKYDSSISLKEQSSERGNLNGIDRKETDQNIRKIFGTLDDFLLTSMTSQIGSLSFINEGSTKRKEILSKFLDLDLFSKKFKLANDDASQIKGALKRLEGRDFDSEILQASIELEDNEHSTESHKVKCESIKQQIEKVNTDLSEIDREIASCPKMEILDISKTEAELLSFRKRKIEVTSKNAELSISLAEDRSLLKDVQEFIESIEIEDVENKKKILFQQEKELNNILSKISSNEERITSLQKKVQLLNEVPCGDKFPNCKFLHDAYAAKPEIKSEQDALIVLNRQREDKVSSIDQLNPDEIEKMLEKFTSLNEKKRVIESRISQNQIHYEKNNTIFVTIENNIREIEKKIEEYNKNIEAVSKLKKLSEKRKEISEEVKELQNSLEKCDSETIELYKTHGSLEQKITSLKDMKNEMNDLRKQYAAYEMYEKCMHSNGITYDIIKKRLPIINEEIAKILSNVVNFDIFFEDDGKKLDILIKHPKYDARPLELGSGAEKMLAAMAIRLSLIKISSLPQGDLFILDEPATALDEENMEGFIRIVEMLKSQFKTIIIISHLDALKDIVDRHIVIEKKDGMARVEV